MSTETNGTETQGVGSTEKKEKKTQAVSISYTLKSQGENIKKLQEAGILTKEVHAQWLKLHTEAVTAWTKKEFGL